MNKIVREHYPVEKLPEDLRADLPAGAVLVTIEVSSETGDDNATTPLSGADAIALMRQMQRENADRGTGITEAEAVRRIRELRDEWDD